MRRTVALAVMIALGLATAIMLRLHDQPYIAYADGRPAEALDGLAHKALAGDGFAAFLVGETYRRTADGTAAETWYMTAAQNGEVRAVAPYIQLVEPAAPTPGQCAAALALLNSAGRAGEPNALVLLGNYYEYGRCVDIDLVTAAGYYLAATKVDRRYGDRVDLVIAKLDPATAQGLRANPATFDLTAKEAVTQFIVEAPALQASPTNP